MPSSLRRGTARVGSQGFTALPKGKFVLLLGTMGVNQWIGDLRVMLHNRLVDQYRWIDLKVDFWDPKVHVPFEEEAKRRAAYHLFYIGSPDKDRSTISTLATAEAFVSLTLRPRSTVIVFQDEASLTGHAVGQMREIKARLREAYPTAHVFQRLEDAIDWLVPRVSATGDPDQPHNWAYRRDTPKVRRLVRKARWHLNHSYDTNIVVTDWEFRKFHHCMKGHEVVDTYNFKRIAIRAVDELRRSGLQARVTNSRDGFALEVSRL